MANARKKFNIDDIDIEELARNAHDGGAEPETGFKNWLFSAYPFILASIPYFVFTVWFIYF